MTRTSACQVERTAKPRPHRNATCVPGDRLLARLFTLSALTLCLVCGAPRSLADEEPVATGPEVKAFRLGALEISVLRDGGLAIPNDGSVFGLNAKPANVAQVLRNTGAPTDKVRLDIDVLLVRMKGHLALIDSGYGPAGHGVLTKSLASAGASPGEITDVLITHSHTDHVGGLVDAQGNSAFPQATIRMSANEWSFMQSRADTRAIATAVKAQVKTFEPGRALLPGIAPRALRGHTPGHVGYEITSQGQRLMDIGDAAHSSIVSLAKPDWTIAWDSDQGQGVKTRRQELQHLASTHELMFAPHFPFPGVGKIVPAGDGFRFQPDVPTGKQE